MLTLPIMFDEYPIVYLNLWIEMAGFLFTSFCLDIYQNLQFLRLQWLRSSYSDCRRRTGLIGLAKLIGVERHFPHHVVVSGTVGHTRIQVGVKGGGGVGY